MLDTLLSPPDVGSLEQDYLLAAPKSGWVAPAGPDLKSFEDEVASRAGVAHAVALGNMEPSLLDGDLCRRVGARLLSDSAESFGATNKGRAAGSFGDASVLSFNGNKIMTTSRVGMLLTNDAELAAHDRKLSTQARGLVAASRAAQVVPEMAGAEEPKIYLFVFQNKAEVRGTGGLPGSWSGSSRRRREG